MNPFRVTANSGSNRKVGTGDLAHTAVDGGVDLGRRQVLEARVEAEMVARRQRLPEDVMLSAKTDICVYVCMQRVPAHV